MASVQQITYQMIIDYLSPNKVVKNEMGVSSFPTKENIVINVSDFPKKIKRFFFDSVIVSAFWVVGFKIYIV